MLSLKEEIRSRGNYFRLKKDSIRTYSKLLLKLGLAALAVYFITTKVDFENLWEHFKEANAAYVILAFFCFFISKLISVFRLDRFYQALKITIPKWSLIKLYAVGMFYNLFVPGGIGGEGYKVYWINRAYQQPIKRLIWTSIWDRLSGLLALGVLTVLIIPFISFQTGYNNWSVLAIPPAYLVYVLVVRRFFSYFRSTIITTSLLSIVVQLLQVVSAHCLLLAMHVDAQLVDYWFIFLVSSIAYAVPVVGVRELVFVIIAGALQLDKEVALAISLLFYINLILTSLLGIYPFFVPKSIKS